MPRKVQSRWRDDEFGERGGLFWLIFNTEVSNVTPAVLHKFGVLSIPWDAVYLAAEEHEATCWVGDPTTSKRVHSSSKISISEADRV